MKRGTIRHPKLLRLARRLNCQPHTALGVLEALLDWAYTFARRGDVGHFSDEDLAEAVGWQGPAGDFVTALVETRWLDRCSRHRLVIHDLADHADRTWKRALDRAGETFARPQWGVSGASVGVQRDTLTPPARPEPEPDLLSLATLAQGFTSPPSRFAEFWLAYPKRRHRPAAERAWRKGHGDPTADAILAGLERWKRSAQWAEGRIEDPATFLNQRQWEDPVPPATSAGRSDSAEAIAARLQARAAQERPA